MQMGKPTAGGGGLPRSILSALLPGLLLLVIGAAVEGFGLLSSHPAYFSDASVCAQPQQALESTAGCRASIAANLTSVNAPQLHQEYTGATVELTDPQLPNSVTLSTNLNVAIGGACSGLQAGVSGTADVYRDQVMQFTPSYATTPCQSSALPNYSASEIGVPFLFFGGILLVLGPILVVARRWVRAAPTSQ
jgi:hypothetical protein